jgi:hypothetical protein
MELVLEWDRPVSVRQARQEQRRLLDGLTLASHGFSPQEPFALAKLVSPRAGRVLRITFPDAIDPIPPDSNELDSES